MLDKAHRLNKHGSFSYVYRKGTRLAAPDVVLIYTPARSVRVGNRLAALGGCQAIVVANPSAADKRYAELDGELAELFARAGLLRK